MEVLLSRKFVPVSAIAILMCGTALADAPKVAVDIAPVHSLVSRVMQGVGAPDLIIPPTSSPHSYNLRPSEAKALQDANMVFWMGEDLTPWMERSLASLSVNAEIVTLLDERETKLLEFREGALFEAHDHDDHGKKDGHDDHDEHAHGAHDPHAWLSTENAKNWLNLIAAKLSSIDTENAGLYFANASAGRTEIDNLVREINDVLKPVRGRSFIVFHDAYQYFETSFDFPASGAISLGDASDPSPARVAEIQSRVKNEGVTCVLAEPQFNPGIVDTVLAGTDAKTGEIDPLGFKLEPGPNLYPQLIRNMANTLSDCL